MVTRSAPTRRDGWAAKIIVDRLSRSDRIRPLTWNGLASPSFIVTVFAGLILCGGVSIAAETTDSDAPRQAGAGAVSQLGFSSIRSVEGELTETARRQSKGSVAGFHRRKQALRDRTGLTYGFDNQAQYLATDSDRSPSDAASNVTRFYGTWTAAGQNTPDDRALVFKAEYRTAIGNKVSTQALGPSLGYAGAFSSTYSDAGLVLTNLYWRQHFAGGRGGFVAGQVDAYDYVNVNSISSPWVAFTNLAFEQQPTLPAPAQGLGAAARWRLDENWQVLAGFADANADPSEPWESATDLFDEFETFKHVAIGWAPDWAERYDRTLQLTIWQVDERKQAGVEDGYGAAVAASGRRDAWRPFLRVGYADGAGAVLERAISLGTGYDARGGKDLAGIAVNWGRAPDSSRDQYTLEAFYRYDITDFLQLTPQIQYVIDPANDPATDNILVIGIRVRAFF